MKKMIFYFTLILFSFFQFNCKKEAVLIDTKANAVPVADAGADQTIYTDSSPIVITLEGRGTDADGTIVSYLWTKVSGSSIFNIIIDSPNAVRTVVKGLSSGTYGLELKVTDNNGAVGRDTVMISVIYAPPAIDTLIIGDWFSGALIQDNGFAEDYYEGYYTFTRALNYDWRTHTVVSFVKRPGVTEPIYQRQSMEIEVLAPNQTDTFHYTFEFGGENTGFILIGLAFLNNPLPPIFNFINAVALAKTYQYRFIVVSNTMYNSMNINWNNYLEVAAALQFSP